MEVEYNGALYKNKGDIQKRNNYEGYQIVEPYYEDLGESGGDESEKRGVHLRKWVWIKCGAFDYRPFILS
ncbi:hypothetical protein H5410_043428 [Solanum commersonii]|uniref:Uncharacterized protein n=1 Tax=Solanum commersonii TaxID=4109 RepID=A0A9J5XYU3_SOLCO|nr:hypothetical protein H5410_043428 [Solanum commersonii]